MGEFNPGTKSIITVIDPPALGKPHPLYSAITAFQLSSTITQYNISGQVAVDPVTGSVPSDLASQIDLCLERLSICLDAINARKVDIAKFMYYIKAAAMKDVDEKEGAGAGITLVGRKTGAWLGGHRPASCLNQILGMSDEVYMIELEATVIVSVGNTDAI